MKKILSLFLSLSLLLSMATGFSLKAFAEVETGQCGENVTYSFDSATGILTISGSGEMYHYYNTLEEARGGSPLNGNSLIGPSVKKIIIKNGVTDIGDCMFYGCENLTEVVLPDTVTKICDSAFWLCTALQSFTIPDTVTEVGVGIFNACSGLKNVVLPKQLKSITQWMFNGCSSLSSIIIPSTVTSIDYAAFADCTALNSIAFPDGLTTIGEYAFKGCTALKSITLPDTVTQLGSNAFADCTGLNSATLGDGLVTVDKYAFNGCSALKTLHIGNALEFIGDSAFSGCDQLTDLYISSLEQFCNMTVEGNVSNPLNYTSNLYLQGQLVTDLVIPDSVTAIPDYRFFNCKSIQTLQLGKGVKTVGKMAFGAATNLKTADFGTAVETIDNYAFNGVGLEKLRIDTLIFPKTLKDVGERAFNYMEGTVYYAGSKSEWSAVHISSQGNYVLSFAYNTHIYFNHGAEHSYQTTVQKATLQSDGLITSKCSCGKVKSTQTIAYPKTIKLSKKTYTYDGKVKKPTVTVKDADGKVIPAKYYKVTYAKGRKAVGTYKVTVKFKGNYSGTKQLTFKINPKSTAITKVTAKKKGFTVKWKKQTAQTTGYQIQYSTSSKFTKKTTKTITIKTSKTAATTVSKLKAKKKYYVRIRSYKTVGKTKYYSSWSKTKTVTTKK